MAVEQRAGGRDSLPALQRVVTVVSVLNAAGERGVPADELIEAAGYGGAQEGRREQLARDVRTLVRQGWVIDNIAPAGTSAVYRMSPGDPRIRLAFDEVERAQFQRAAQIAGVSSSRVDESLSASGDAGEATELRRTLRLTAAYRLELALHGHEHRCLLRFRYRDVDRVITPDAIWRQEGRWYLVGRTPGEGDQRNFRIDRMDDLRLDRPGSAEAPLADTAVGADPLTFADGPAVEAVVAVHPDHRRRTERSLGRAHTVVRDGGEVQLTITVVSHLTFLRRLCELDTRVRLVGPESLRQELRDLLEPHLGTRS